LLIAQVVNFLLLMLILRLTLYQPVLRMLDQRKERIAQSMRDAERVSAAAQEAESEKAKVLDAARREAQEIRAQATRDAEKIAQEIRSRAEQDATEVRIRAQEDAEKQVQTALTEANRQITELAILATEQLLGRELAQRSEQERFVSDFLAQHGVQSNGSAG
jgi:F-type H+-transporting ATPase subunit b